MPTIYIKSLVGDIFQIEVDPDEPVETVLTRLSDNGISFPFETTWIYREDDTIAWQDEELAALFIDDMIDVYPEDRFIYHTPNSGEVYGGYEQVPPRVRLIRDYIQDRAQRTSFRLVEWTEEDGTIRRAYITAPSYQLMFTPKIKKIKKSAKKVNKIIKKIKTKKSAKKVKKSLKRK